MEDLDQRFQAARAGFASVAEEFGLSEGEPQARGYGRWTTFRSRTHSFLLEVDAGDAPWLSVRAQSGQGQDVETIAHERATARGEVLPHRPHRGSREIGEYLADLCRRFLRPELEGSGG